MAYFYTGAAQLNHIKAKQQQKAMSLAQNYAKLKTMSNKHNIRDYYSCKSKTAVCTILTYNSIHIRSLWSFDRGVETAETILKPAFLYSS